MGVPSRVRFSLICNKGRGGQLRSFELPQVPASDCASASLRPRQRNYLCFQPRREHSRTRRALRVPHAAVEGSAGYFWVNIADRQGVMPKRSTAVHDDSMEKALLNVPNLLKCEQGSLEYALTKVEEAQSKDDPNELKKAKAYVAICESKIAKLHQLQPAFVEFAAEVSNFSKGRDPRALMNPDDMAHLGLLWARNPEFAAFHSNQGKFPIDYLKNEMFKALPADDTPAFAAFPAPVRDLINQKRAPRPQWWFMAVHYAKRLQEAARLGVPNATKHRLNNIAAYRKRIDELQPKDALAIFRRIASPKSGDVTKLEADITRTEAELEKLRQLEVPFKQFVDEASNWTRDRDPWSLMQPADVAQLDAQMKRAREDSGISPLDTYHTGARSWKT